MKKYLFNRRPLAALAVVVILFGTVAYPVQAFAAFTINYLIVAGGGGGGGGPAGGGGGAGGMLTGATTTVAVGTYSIVVGGGGNAGQSGQNSTALGVTPALGGGTQGTGGGSGGGGNGSSGAGGAGTAGQGNNGGNGQSGTGGGGGGKGGAGARPTAGIGEASSISGSSVTYAKGGQGDSVQVNGTANKGEGGSGGSSAGSGGSGVVILSYTTTDFSGYTVTGGTKTTNGANTVHTFNSGADLVIEVAAAGGASMLMSMGM